MARRLEELALVAETQSAVDKEVKKLKFYVGEVNMYRRKGDFEKLKRLLENAKLTKLNIAEDLIEKMTVLLIDSEKSEDEAKQRIARTRERFPECNREISEARKALRTYYDSVQEQRARMQLRIEQQRQKETHRRMIE